MKIIYQLQSKIMVGAMLCISLTSCMSKKNIVLKNDDIQIQHKEKEEHNTTKLFQAIESKNYKQLKKILDKLNKKEKKKRLAARDENGYTPLHLAIKKGRENIIKLLLDNKADPKAKDQDGFSIFIYPVMNNNIDVLENLIKNEVDINMQDDEEDTPLHTAVLLSKHQAIKFLIKNGADINAKDKKGRTPFQVAVIEECISSIKILIETGKINIEEKWKFRDVAGMFDDYYRLKYHIAAGVINEDEEYTPLQIAILAGLDHAIPSLIKNGADITVEDQSKRSLKDLARLCNHTVSTKTLLLALNEKEEKSGLLSTANEEEYTSISEQLASDEEEMDFFDFLDKIKTKRKKSETTKDTYINSDKDSPVKEKKRNDASNEKNDSCSQDKQKDKEEDTVDEMMILIKKMREKGMSKDIFLEHWEGSKESK